MKMKSFFVFFPQCSRSVSFSSLSHQCSGSFSARPLWSHQQSRCSDCHLPDTCDHRARETRRRWQGWLAHWLAFPSLRNEFPGSLARLARKFQVGLVAVRIPNFYIFECGGERRTYIFHRLWDSDGFGETSLVDGWPTCKSLITGRLLIGHCQQESCWPTSPAS